MKTYIQTNIEVSDVSNLTEEQKGNLFVEMDDMEAVYEALEAFIENKNKDKVPEVLYKQDKLIGKTAKDLSFEDKKILDKVLEIDDINNVIMGRIKELNKVVDGYFKDMPWFFKLYGAWKRDISGQQLWDSDSRWLNDSRNTKYLEVLDRRAQLWNTFNTKREEAKQLVGKKGWIWAEFFKLKNIESIDSRNIYGDTEQVDNSTVWENRLTSNEIADGIRDSHLEEQQELLLTYQE